MSCLSTENGAKVNMIKQKFERNNVRSNEEIENENMEEEQKDFLRRSLSASPVKAKKNLKSNVTRQLSNPGKNIKRTPAFRGDKLIRTKNLNSPSREKSNSIVNQNVKMFEEKPEYGKIGNVKKRDAFVGDLYSNDVTDSDGKKRTGNCRPLTKDNTVRTTVISRQKNISQLYKLDDVFVPTIIKIKEDDPKNLTNNEFDKFLMNGAEYTKVTKSSSCSEDNSIAKLSKNFPEDGGKDDVDNCGDSSARLSHHEDNSRLELTDSLKAALKAPLPPGPPPKKPPRTFAHSPLSQRSRLNTSESNSKATSSSEESQKDAGIDELDSLKRPKDHYEIIQSDEDLHNILEIFDERKARQFKITESPKTRNFPTENDQESTSSSKSRSTRDSKRMLKKLETVLIQHQQAIGSKVILARTEKNQLKIDSRKKPQSDSESVVDKQEKRGFHNRLPNTLEDSKKHGSLNKIHETKSRKPSAFDCLPYLNCASSSVYEQPNFRNYLGESELKDVKSKSEYSSYNSISDILSSNNDLSDDMLCPASKRLSIELTTFLDSKKRQSIPVVREEERVYAEPFTFDKNSGTDITGLIELSPEEHNYLSKSWQRKKIPDKSEEIESPGKNNKELHYLCTTIDPGVLEYNNNGPEDNRKLSCDSLSFENFFETTNSPDRRSFDGLNRIKVNELLNKAFGQFVMAGTELSTDSNPSSDTDSLASSTPSIGEESTSFNEKLRLFKNRETNLKTSKEELQRNLTEKRKHYVRRVSIKYSENREPSLRGRRDRLFEVCLLVELNLSTRKPYIKDKYPIYANSPDWIESFCFPDAQNWPPTDSNSNQFYSLFLMDEKGNRRYGYCCRVKPENGPILPLAYCVITKYRASGFYRKVLQELESRHGLPNTQRRNFIEELYNSPMPKPGDSLKIITEKFRYSGESNSNDNNNDALSKLRDGGNEERLSIKSMELSIDSDNCANVILRSGDPRLDEGDIIQLFEAVSNKVLIYLFGCLLLERRVVLISNNLCKLSCCVEALQSLLYPFTWPHTFIPVLPDIPGIVTILEAPLPFVIGILKNKDSANYEVPNVQDGIVVDLDTSKIICAVGDESSILPSRLQKGIKSALQLITKSNKSGNEVRNFMVSEAFLRVFVETCAHLEGHLVTQQDGKVIFQKDSFVKASNSKTVQYFLEWFVETTMFNAFVADYIGWIEGKTVEEKNDIKLFSQRVAEYLKSGDKNAQSRNNSKKKTLGDRLKDLTNFYN